jgi:[ribosomal protein S18]-alanine N-acetyltransferase
MQTTFDDRMRNCTRSANADTLQIRRATPVDIPQIRRLELHSEAAAHWTASQYDALFSPDAPSRLSLVAIGDSSAQPIQGFLVARCLSDEWEIENIVVNPSNRQRGIGRSLVRALLWEAQSAGIASIILEVRASNGPAVRLYENIGFKQEGRRKDYYQFPAEDAILFRFLLQTYDKIY